MAYIQEAIGRQSAFNVTIYQTNKTSTSASYIVKVNSNKDSKGYNYFFGESGNKIMVKHNPGDGYKNIIIGSGVDYSGDIGKELKRWAFPKISEWNYSNSLYYLYSGGSRQNLWTHFYPPDRKPYWSDKEEGFVTGSEIYSKEYTVDIDRGTNKKAYKTVKAKIDGTSGVFGDVEVSLALVTSEVLPASLDTFEVTQSDKNDKDRKITVDIKVTNPEQYYTFVVKHNDSLLAMKKYENEFCIDIPITREMYSSMQKFSVIIYCANGEVEVPETTREIYIEDAGVGIWYKDESHPKGAEVEEVWYKDHNGTLRNVTEAWVKRSNKVVKTIK